jgi:hypothetical protein
MMKAGMATDNGMILATMVVGRLAKSRIKPRNA